MTISEYKEALKNMIDATDDETILKGWKTHMEPEFEQYQQQRPNKDKDEDEGYVILESGLGIDE